MKGNSPASRGPADSRVYALLRDLKDRVRVLENRPKITVGGWRLYEDDEGNLVASRDGHRQVLSRATLPAGEGET